MSVLQPISKIFIKADILKDESINVLSWNTLTQIWQWRVWKIFTKNKDSHIFLQMWVWEVWNNITRYKRLCCMKVYSKQQSGLKTLP